MLPNATSRRARRAVTLIEVLVAAGVGTAVLGIVLGLMVQIRSACTSGQDRLTMQAHAEKLAEDISAVLYAAVAPASLDNIGAEGASRLVCEPEKCAVVSALEFDGRDFYVLEIVNDVEEVGGEEENKNAQVVSLRRHTLNAELTKHGREDVRSLGISSRGDDDKDRVKARFDTKVEFQYAQGPLGAERNVNLNDRLAPGKFPSLVKMHITVSDRTKQLQPFELVAAVRM